MEKSAVLHKPYSEYCFALATNKLVIRLRAKREDLKSCYLYYGDRMDPHTPIDVTRVQMELAYQDEWFDYFEAEFEINITRVCYYFKLTDQCGETIYYYNQDFHNEVVLNRQLYYNFHYVREEDIPDVPEWAKNAIVYQIYPDSFATGKGFISKVGNRIKNADGSFSESKFGGTLKGITENIDYLVELGINCIYMTPIFKSLSWHKYDSVDYLEIDPCLGTKENLKELVETCHQNGIKVILDGVFNHCSPDFFAFKDVLEKGEQSQYVDWFYIKNFPIVRKPCPNYECFAYVDTMPKLNTGNEEVKKYLGRNVIFQEYIPSSFGRDIRLQVVGDRVITAMYRYSENGDFRANISNGGKMKPYQWTKEQEELAVRSTKAIGLDFAGVDILFGEKNIQIIQKN